VGEEELLHREGVEVAVGLHPLAPDRRPLGAVQDPGMDRRPVGGPADQPAQGGDLVDQLALARPPHRRVAGHRAHPGGVQGDQGHPRPHAGGGVGGLDPGVAAPDHGHVERFT